MEYYSKPRRLVIKLQCNYIVPLHNYKPSDSRDTDYLISKLFLSNMLKIIKLSSLYHSKKYHFQQGVTKTKSALTSESPLYFPNWYIWFANYWWFHFALSLSSIFSSPSLLLLPNQIFIISHLESSLTEAQKVTVQRHLATHN